MYHYYSLKVSSIRPDSVPDFTVIFENFNKKLKKTRQIPRFDRIFYWKSRDSGERAGEQDGRLVPACRLPNHFELNATFLQIHHFQCKIHHYSSILCKRVDTFGPSGRFVSIGRPPLTVIWVL